MPFTETYIPDFAFEIVDISHIPDEQIKGELLVRAFMLMLKYNRGEGLFRALPKILSLIDGLSNKTKVTEYIEIFLRYLMANVEKDKKEELNREIEKSLKYGGTIMPTIADELIREGMERGIEKGIEKRDIEIAEKMILNEMNNSESQQLPPKGVA